MNYSYLSCYFTHSIYMYAEFNLMLTDNGSDNGYTVYYQYTGNIFSRITRNFEACKFLENIEEILSTCTVMFVAG